MEKKVLAVCDGDREYAENFMKYVNSTASAPFEVRAYTSWERFCEEAVSLRGPAIALVSESAEKEREMSGGMPAGTLLIRFTETPVEEGPDRRPSVCKYQAVPAILRSVMEIYGGQADVRAPRALLKPEADCIGVYSPLGGALKTSLAAACALHIGLQKPTLFLTMDAWPGFRELLHPDSTRDLSDGIYYLRKEDPAAFLHIQPLIVSMGGCDLLPPIGHPGDLASVTAEEWDSLIHMLREESAYQMLVIDFGWTASCHPELLRTCSRVFFPVKEDVLSRTRVSLFEAQCADLFSPEADRVRKLDLSGYSLPETSDRFFEQLPYSGIGRFAEQLLYKEGVLR